MSTDTSERGTMLKDWSSDSNHDNLHSPAAKSDGAIADLNSALEINSTDVDARCERGILRGAKGDLEGALADFAKVIELDPRHARAYANRGMIMLLRRQDMEAQKELDKALELDSSLKAALQKSVDQIMKNRRYDEEW